MTGFALSGEVLSLVCPRESTQREGQPGARVGVRTTRPLRSLALRSTSSRGAHNSEPERDWLIPLRLASDRARAFPRLDCGTRRGQRGLGVAPSSIPSGAAEHRRHFGMERAALSSWICKPERAGCHSLGYFSWRTQGPIRRERIGTSAGWPAGRSPGMDFAKKSTSPIRAKNQLSLTHSLQHHPCSISPPHHR